MKLNDLKVIKYDNDRLRDLKLPLEKKMPINIDFPDNAKLVVPQSIINSDKNIAIELSSYQPIVLNNENSAVGIPVDQFNQFLTLGEFPEDNNIWIFFSADNLKKFTILGRTEDTARFITRLYKFDEANSVIEQVVVSANIFNNNDQIGFLPSGGFYFVRFQWLEGNRNFNFRIQTSDEASSNEPNDSFYQATPYNASVVRHKDTFDGIYDNDWIKIDLPENGNYCFDMVFTEPSLKVTYSIYLLHQDAEGFVSMVGALENQVTPSRDVNFSSRNALKAGTYYICLTNKALASQLNKEYQLTFKVIKYKYNRYTVKDYVYYEEDSAWEPISDEHQEMVFYKNKNAISLSSYVFDSKTGLYTIPRESYHVDWRTLGGSAYVYLTNAIVDKGGDTLYICKSASGRDEFLGTDVHYKKSRKYTRQVCGDLLTGIIANEDTYPENGIGDDGYWYIRGERYVYPELV